MKKIILSAAFAVISATSIAQTKATYVDGVKVSQQEADKLKVDDISSMKVAKDGNHIVTRTAACNAYWNFFKSKSSQYATLVPTIEKIYKVQYIVNGTLLTSSFDNTLAGINNENLVSINIIDNTVLNKDYGIIDKPYGVVIKTKKTAGK